LCPFEGQLLLRYPSVMRSTLVGIGQHFIRPVDDGHDPSRISVSRVPIWVDTLGERPIGRTDDLRRRATSHFEIVVMSAELLHARRSLAVLTAQKVVIMSQVSPVKTARPAKRGKETL
jgi:hypothetical protein